MKRLISVAGAVFGLLLIAAPAQAQMGNAPEGREMTVTGQVIDISCKFGLGQSGDMHRMCAQVCADKGIPLAILTPEGVLFIPVSEGMPGESENGRLREFAEQTVTVRGTVYDAGGAKAIKIESVSRS